jgi:glycosyltransferase involved in cell wall biosynthesis
MKSSDTKGSENALAPLFTIGVTTYKRRELLKQALLSISGQTFTDFEVIVGNDDTEETLSSQVLGLEDPRIRFVNHSQNLGELGNMNTLLRLARGRYFTWIADDDLYAPNFLQAVEAVLGKSDFPLCVYTSYTFGSTIPEEVKVEREYLVPGNEFLNLYLAGALKAIGTMGIFDREYLKSVGGLEDLTGGSIALYTEYLQIVRSGLLDRVAYIDAPLIIFRGHEGSWGTTCPTHADMDLFKLAGKNLFRRSLEVFRQPKLIADFDQNLTRLLRRFTWEFIYIARAKPSSFSNRELLGYLIFARKYVSSLRGSALYWRAIKCLGRLDAEILWPIYRGKLTALVPSGLRKLASVMRARFRRIGSPIPR